LCIALVVRHQAAFSTNRKHPMNHEILGDDISRQVRRVSQRFLSDCGPRWGKVIVGHLDLLDDILIALIAGGHVLLEGVPGLGKTLNREGRWPRRCI